MNPKPNVARRQEDRRERHDRFINLRSMAKVGSIIAFLTCPGAFATSPGKGADIHGANDNLMFVGVRVLKRDSSDLNWSVELPPNCGNCRLEDNQLATGQNPREFFFHLWVPSDNSESSVRLRVDADKVRGVLVGVTDYELIKNNYTRVRSHTLGVARVPIHRVQGGIQFSLAQQWQDSTLPPDDVADVTEFYTYIRTPGVILRVGHPDPDRRRGGYASGRWPENEARAAINLEFAAREAIMRLGIDRRLDSYGVAAIALMNFDTNYPTLGPVEAHDDWPPHWHMHLYWKDAPTIRKVGHFYIGPDGLLTQNLSGDSEATIKVSWIARGQPDKTTTPTGQLIYTQSVSPEGFFDIVAGATKCELRPAGAGFDSGVNVACGSQPLVREVHAVDDLGKGVLRLFKDSRLSVEYNYDTDTGHLLRTSSSDD
jgi:hypothetical protein